MDNGFLLKVLERNPDCVSGAWVFRGTRVPVAAFFENLKDGASIEQFIEWFPGVQQAQVEALCKISSRPSLLTGNSVESK
ncbi:MAG: DUF433 domain-containing protein [Leptolyngbyaceae cyanobacterium]